MVLRKFPENSGIVWAKRYNNDGNETNKGKKWTKYFRENFDARMYPRRPKEFDMIRQLKEKDDNLDAKLESLKHEKRSTDDILKGDIWNSKTLMEFEKEIKENDNNEMTVKRTNKNNKDSDNKNNEEMSNGSKYFNFDYSDIAARVGLASLLLCIVTIFGYFVAKTESIELTENEIIEKYYLNENKTESDRDNENDNGNNNKKENNDDSYFFGLLSESKEAKQKRGLKHLEILKILLALKNNLNSNELCFDSKKEYEYHRYTVENDLYFGKNLDFINISQILSSMSSIELSYLPPFDFVRYGDAQKYKQCFVYLNDYHEYVPIVMTFNVDKIDSKHLNMVAILLGYKQYFLKAPLNEKDGTTNLDGKWGFEVQDFANSKIMKFCKDKRRIFGKKYIDKLGDGTTESLLKYEFDSCRESIEARLNKKAEKERAKQEKKIQKQFEKEKNKENTLFKRMSMRIKGTNDSNDQNESRDDTRQELNQIMFTLKNFEKQQTETK